MGPKAMSDRAGALGALVAADRIQTLQSCPLKEALRRQIAAPA